jgi:glycosyltransferase involved in cell wall biosynthesis
VKKKNTIRAAMIIQEYHPVLGGAQRQLAALAPLLRDRHIDLHILTRRYSGLTAYELIEGTPVHRLPVPGPKAVAAISFTLAALLLLRRLKPDVIHAHELLSPTTAAIAAKRMLNIPVAAKVLRGGSLGDLAKLKRKPFGRQRINSSRRWVDMFITISREIDRELAEVGVPVGHRVFIPNGVDPVWFAPLTIVEKRARRVSLGLPDEVPITIFSGRLEMEKRIDQLISIWPAVRAIHTEARLLILGTGNEEAKLKQIAGPGVDFLGQVNDVAPYLQTADLFILPSVTEGLSNALLEALATGLPVIATTVGGAPDVVEHGISGWLVPPDVPAELQAAVLELLSDPDRRHDLGLKGRQRVAQNYTLPETARRLRMLYCQLVGG